MDHQIILSICIPTINRCYYLIDTIKDTIKQAKEAGLENLIEFCISDNNSTDNTKEELLGLQKIYPNIKFKLNFFSESQGFDKNCFQVINMQEGLFTLIKGDDDYFTQGGVKRLFELIDQNPDIDYFVADYNIINTKHQFLNKMHLLRDGIESLTVDFSNVLEARNYFNLCNRIEAFGSFISDTFLKTEAFRNIQVDPLFYGTQYIHEYFFWKYLLSGHKLLYTSTPIMDATGGNNSNYGGGVSRNALDIKSFAFIGNYFFGASSLNEDFINVVNKMYKDYRFIPIDQRKAFKLQLYPALLESKHPLAKNILRSSKTRYLIMYAILSLFPQKIVNYIRKILK